jgi:hypothetical protein
MQGVGGVTFDSNGNFFIADNGNNVVHFVNRSTGNMSIIAGILESAGHSGDGGPATNAQLNYPSGVTFDTVGDLYISDQSNNAIRVVSVTSGNISTVAGILGGVAGASGDKGPATNAQLNLPLSTAIDSAGTLYIADTSNFAVRYVYK